MTSLTIPTISCGHCVKTITETLTMLDADAIVKVDLTNKNVSVQSRLGDADVREALTQAGYPPAP